jgi:transcriptional regulator with XRE-family HTH domain
MATRFLSCGPACGFASLGPGRPGADHGQNADGPRLTLARQLGSNDAAAISRYENGKMTPTVEVVIRLAEIFDVSTDYLLIDGASRRSFADTGDELTERIGMASRLSATDNAAIVHIIDGLLANTRVRAALDEAR